MQSLDVTVHLPPELRLPVPGDLELGEDFVREEVLAWHTDEERGVDHFLSLVVGDLETCLAGLESLPMVNSVDVTPVDDETFYAYAEMEAGPDTRAWTAALEGHDIVLVPPIVFTPYGDVQLTVLGDPGELREVVADFPEGIEFEVERVGEHQHRPGSLAGRLTTRQFQAMEAAYRLGYYSVPREGTLAEVAEALDCSESAASTLLRKAERAMVEATLGRGATSE
ncbi:helix-turn-helix domain-containing protein [Haloarchaeobius sp. DT45]|uniref:helix-turn-helix domain-containing protein n=1 Tax=Haloarchaeobius sp. DT45 TaxID=3446116 RepID=UPI003F6C8E61